MLYNIDRDVDSLFMPLIYHITTSASEDIEKGEAMYNFCIPSSKTSPAISLLTLSGTPSVSYGDM